MHARKSCPPRLTGQRLPRVYGDLMRTWKQVPRGHRREDDKLWARFRAAQDVFFNARNEAEAAQDAVYAENLKVKEALLEKHAPSYPSKTLRARRQPSRRS